MESENSGPKPSNTEYNPIKCRTTRPPPPPPATNPLQFVKVGPCPLYKKAQEQIKKVEEVKSTKKHNADEMEEWQHNLDNWKNCRRKRQEHIIERVEEVKKIELESSSRSKRRSSTFDEIRKRRGLKSNIAFYGDEDDTLNISEYITQSESDDCRYSDSDNNNSIEDKKDLAECTSKEINDGENKVNTNETTETIKNEVAEKENNNSNQYTYEGAIEGYRSRICMNINVDKSIFERPTDFTTLETSDVSPPKSILKRKELFESRKSIDSTENNSSIKLTEDLANSRSIKERLQSLKLCTDQQSKNLDKTEFPVGTVKSRLQKLMEINETKNECDKFSTIDTSNKISSKFEISSNHEDENINLINKEDFLNPSYQPSNSSVDLLTSSDREDSGIHTADVSCSVSQSDEAFEDADLSSNTIPKCIEKLNNERHNFIDDVAKVDLKQDEKIFEIDYSYIKAIITEFLENERKNSCDDKKTAKVVHSPLVENIKMYLREEENILSNEEVENKKISTFNPLDGGTADVIDLTACPIDFIKDIFVNPLPSPKLKPPSEKPPPPPKPMGPDQRLDATKRIKMERSSFLGIDNSDELNQEKRDLTVSNKVASNNEIQSISSLVNNKDIRNDKQEVLPSVEDEITKREREIIELMEKEEKTKDKTQLNDVCYKFSPDKSEESSNSLEDTFGSKKFDTPYFPETEYDTSDEQYSEVLKVEQELLQLEREELKRQRENMLFEEKLLKNKNACENICDINRFNSNVDFCKSMPDLQQVPINNVNMAQFSNYIPNNESSSEYCKSMPDIQRAYNRSLSEYPDKTILNRTAAPVRRLHYPEANFYRRSSSAPRSTQMYNSPKNMSPVKLSKSIDDPRAIYVNINSPVLKQGRDKIQALNPLPRLSQNQAEPWIHPKAKIEVKNYDQHWFYQEAELRRISEQKAKLPSVYNKTFNECNPSTSIQNAKGINYLESNASKQRKLAPLNLDYVPHLCMPNSHKSVAYPSPLNLEEAQDIILSVSGKKKCSFCGNELGRGAAMIIESLHLFYHMECFRCCVCRVELGDGMMGIDVRVRNQKLHCHNCYSSEDGIKFSCV